MIPRAACLAALLSVPTLPAAAQQVASVTLSHTTIQLRVGQRAGVYATANDARGVVLVGQRFDWSTSDARIVRVEVDREQTDLAYLVGLAEGLAQVQVRAGSRTDAVAVQVTRADAAPPPPVQPAGPPPAVIRIEPSNVALLPVETRALAVMFLREDGSPAAPSPVTWVSHNPAVATVTVDGRVVGQSDGRSVIEARSATGLVATASVEVASADIAFAPAQVGMPPGSELLAQVVVPAQGNRPLAGPAFSWRSSDLTVARVSTLGLVQAVGPGHAVITAEGLGRSATLGVSVHRPVAELQWLPRRDLGPVTVPLNGSVGFTVDALDAQGQAVPDAVLLWTVRDSAVARFDTATRRLFGRALGRTEFKLKGPGPGLDVTWEIQVIAGGVQTTPDRVGLAPRDTVAIAANWADESGQPIGAAADLTWKTTNAAVASVTAAGRVTALGAGRAQIVGTTAWGKADTTEVYVQGPVIVSSTRGGSVDLYAVDPGTPGAPLRLTSDPAVETMGAYSPDGAGIAYVSNRDGPFDLYVANADGTSPRRLTQTPGTEFTPRWMPDGKSIVFAAQAPGARVTQVWVVGADGAGARALTEGAATNFEPAVSPDGSTIAFTSTRDGTYDIYLMAADGSQQRNVSRSPGKESHPAWFATGQLAYLQERTTGGRVATVVVRHDLSTGQTTPLTPADLAVTDFAVSPDGDLLVLEISAIGAAGRFDRRILFFPLSGGQRSELPRQAPTEQFSSPSYRPRPVR